MAQEWICPYEAAQFDRCLILSILFSFNHLNPTIAGPILEPFSPVGKWENVGVLALGLIELEPVTWP